MGVLVLAALTGSVAALLMLLSGFGLLSAILVYFLAGISSFFVIALPMAILCIFRKLRA